MANRLIRARRCVTAHAAGPAGASAVVGLLETTDIHSNVTGHDYFRLAPEPSLGLGGSAALIAQARKQTSKVGLSVYQLDLSR